MASLNIVKSEIDVTIEATEAALRLFVDHRDELDALLKTNQLLTQLCGVFRVIRLDGAAVLTMDMMVLCVEIINRFKAGESESPEMLDTLECLGCSLLILSHYLSFVYVKQYNLPVLLVPAVNQIRRFLSLPLVNEYDFVALDIPVMQLQETPVVDGVEPVALRDIPKLAKRLRHMYQVGLIGVVRDISVETNLRIMYRAVERLACLTGDVPLAQLWWITLGVLEALIDGKVHVNSSRKMVLSKIDRQIKLLVYEGIVYLNELMPLPLLRECLYIIAIASPQGIYVPNIREAFGLEDIYMSDRELRQLDAEMNGPRGSVVFTVVDTLREELLQVKEDIEVLAVAERVEPYMLHQPAETLNKVASTLSLLGLPDSGVQMNAIASELRQCLANNNQVSRLRLDEMAHGLLEAERSITAYNARFSHCMIEAPHQGELDATHQQVDGQTFKHLDETDMVTLEACRSDIFATQQAINAYLASHWDVTHLADIPQTLHSVWGGLLFLHFDRAAAIVRSCEHYIQGLLSQQGDAAPIGDQNEGILSGESVLSEEERRLGRVLGRATEETVPVAAEPSENPSDDHHKTAALGTHKIETLADAFCSLDFYLESIQIRKPIGAAVLQVAEESLQELGCDIEPAVSSQVA